MKKNIIFILMSVLLLSSCDDLFSPAPENLKTLDQMYTDATYAQGVLLSGYYDLPDYYTNTDYATDDAVTNLTTSSYLLMATGAWTSSNNPVNMWYNSYRGIQYLNLFLENVDKVEWTTDARVTKLFKLRTKGEAYGLRALHMYYLLRSHAGYSASGALLGVPLVTSSQSVSSDFNLPRATFQECIDQINKDLDSAVYYLPYVYNDITDSTKIPDKYKSVTTTMSIYNRVMGACARQLVNGLVADAVRSRVTLLAASPAFQDATNTTTWADAADAAADVIDYNGGVSGLAANGVTYYTNTTEIEALSNAANPPEILWRGNLSTSSYDQESANYPPTLNGSGRMNPTQNLVDAFPTATGYPITDVNSGYDATNPYANRDPRLAKYIIYNGATEGVSSTKIYTGSLSGSNDGINVTTTSTRTGYYMKKRLRMDVNRSSSGSTSKTHLVPRIRYTEIYLNYAEAANEAWGPTGTGTHTYSAYDVIKAIRARALGITTDPYLEECAADGTGVMMRNLIRNERRLELCFESFRFWDLRRWKSTSMKETAQGLDVSTSIETPFNVEVRSYEDYMYYGPIPYTELLKYSNLVQNAGW